MPFSFFRVINFPTSQEEKTTESNFPLPIPVLLLLSLQRLVDNILVGPTFWLGKLITVSSVFLFFAQELIQDYLNSIKKANVYIKLFNQNHFQHRNRFRRSQRQGLQPQTGGTCFTPLTNMSDCLSYVQEGSKTTAPGENCCPEVAGLVDSNPICLCHLLSNSSLTENFGIKIDMSRALKLPSVCRITSPPVSTCADLGFPVPPTASEGPMTNTSPTASQLLPPSGLASSPSAGGNGNGVTNISNSALSFLIGFAFSMLLTFS